MNNNYELIEEMIKQLKATDERVLTVESMIVILEKTKVKIKEKDSKRTHDNLFSTDKSLGSFNDWD